MKLIPLEQVFRAFLGWPGRPSRTPITPMTLVFPAERGSASWRFWHWGRREKPGNSLFRPIHTQREEWAACVCIHMCFYECICIYTFNNFLLNTFLSNRGGREGGKRGEREREKDWFCLTCKVRKPVPQNPSMSTSHPLSLLYPLCPLRVALHANSSLWFVLCKSLQGPEALN